MATEYIRLEGQYLVASAGAPYSLKLVGAGWYRTGTTLRTNDLSKGMDFVSFFSPELKKAIASHLTDSQMDKTYVGIAPEGKEFYSFQNESIAYSLRRKVTLIAEEAGLGKTPTAIGVMNADKPKRVLIICPATIKYNWQRELNDWLTYDPGRIHIVDGDDIDVSAEVLIINYDILDRHYKDLYSVNWDMMICDEAHKLKSFQAKRTNIVFGGAYGVGKDQIEFKGIHAKTRELFLSASPLDKHEHLWPLLQRADPGGLGSDWNMYATTYCGAYGGAFGQQLGKSTNSDDLGTHLRARFMVRHYADDVLDLPPLVENTILFPPSSVIMQEQEDLIQENIRTLMNLAREEGVVLPDEPSTADFMQLIGETFIEQSDAMRKPEYAPLFNKMATVRKELGIAKVPLMISHLKEKVDVYDHLTVFAYHKDVIRALCEEFPNHVKVVGGMTPKKKDEAVQKFQKGECQFFFGNITAAGEGVTLTKSHYQAFGEIDWNYTAMLQAKKRLHRISQTSTVNVDYLLVDQTMDTIMAKKVAEKGRTVKGVFAE